MNENRKNSIGTMTKRELQESRSSPPTVIGRSSPIGQLSNLGGPLIAPRSGRRSSSPRLSPCPLSPSPRTSPSSTSPRASISSPLSPRPCCPSSQFNNESPPPSQQLKVTTNSTGTKPKRSPPVVPPRSNSMKKKVCKQMSIESSCHLQLEPKISHSGQDMVNKVTKVQAIDACTNPFVGLDETEEIDDEMEIPAFLGDLSKQIHSNHKRDVSVDQKKISKAEPSSPPKCVVSIPTDLGAEGDDECEDNPDLFDFEEEPELTEIANNILRQLKEREKERAFNLNNQDSMDDDDTDGDGQCCHHNNGNNNGEDEVDRKRRREVITVQSVLKDAENMDDLTDHESEDESLPATYENKTALGDDLLFLASMPELCDVTFLVGETREPVCGVRSILAARSRIFHKLLYSSKKSSSPNIFSGTASTVSGARLSIALRPSSSGSSRGEATGQAKTRDSIDSSRKSSEESTNLANKENMGNNQQQQQQPESSQQSRFGRFSMFARRTTKKKSKDSSIKETKLKLFLKRTSEPLLDSFNFNHPKKSITGNTEYIVIDEFESDVFRQLVEYIHTGQVVLQARTLLGLMNAADYYGLDELKRGCLSFVPCCITVDTVCALLASAERYIQYKCTKSLVQKVLEFVDNHGNEVLGLGSFAILPEHVVRLILSREQLNADELTKFNAVYNWAQRYVEIAPATCDLREIMANFYDTIEFYKIPATVLMREVHPLGVVPDNLIMNALAFQADPKAVDVRDTVSPSRFRRMTLPHSNLAPSELNKLRQQSMLIHGKQERSASTSTSGYEGGSNESNQVNNTNQINLVGNSLKSTSAKIQRSQSIAAKDVGSLDVGLKTGARPKTSLTLAGEKAVMSASGSKESEQKPSDKKSDKISKYLANSKRRASRPFLRAKTLLSDKF